MKRSEINRILEKAATFFELQGFFLPRWAHYSPADWKRSGERYDEIARARLGWDVTDFGSDDFAACGLALFTCRNGVPGEAAKPYCEKVFLLAAGQESPYHFHWQKVEDIIDRRGGRLTVQLRNADEREEPRSDDVEIMVDGLVRLVRAGERLLLSPGESVCLPPRVYHRLTAEESDLLVGEVSSVNDDTTDNRFLLPSPRFPSIVEDAEPVRLLVSDYDRWLSASPGA